METNRNSGFKVIVTSKYLKTVHFNDKVRHAGLFLVNTALLSAVTVHMSIICPYVTVWYNFYQTELYDH